MGAGDGREEGSWCLTGAEVWWLKDDQVLEVNGGDDCTAQGMYLMALNCMSKNH